MRTFTMFMRLFLSYNMFAFERRRAFLITYTPQSLLPASCCSLCLICELFWVFHIFCIKGGVGLICRLDYYAGGLLCSWFIMQPSQLIILKDFFKKVLHNNPTTLQAAFYLTDDFFSRILEPMIADQKDNMTWDTLVIVFSRIFFWTFKQKEKIINCVWPSNAKRPGISWWKRMTISFVWPKVREKEMKAVPSSSQCCVIYNNI